MGPPMKAPALQLTTHEFNDSGVFAAPSRSEQVRYRFVDNWGRLAGTFGMPRELGRLHAQLFLSEESQDVARLSEALGLNRDIVRMHLDSLVDWGVVSVKRDGATDTFVTARDPWEFFLEIVRQRHHREFMPILELIRDTAEIARDLGGNSATRARVEAFSKFVEDLSRLIEVFVRVGSKPMALALKTFAKMAPRAA